jgi:hypothetical protein
MQKLELGQDPAVQIAGQVATLAGEFDQGGAAASSRSDSLATVRSPFAGSRR